MEPTAFTQQLDDAQIAEAIRLAEVSTSGEIRVFITRSHSAKPLEDARREFYRLGMASTALRNAVLLYFAPATQRFAVYGDEGVYLRCEASFWESTTREMEVLLKEGKFHEAVLTGIRRAGDELARQFPKHGADRNDLPNEVVRD